MKRIKNVRKYRKTYYLENNFNFSYFFLVINIMVDFMKVHKITIEIWKKEWTKSSPIAFVDLDWLTPQRLYNLISRGFRIKPKSEMVEI